MVGGGTHAAYPYLCQGPYVNMFVCMKILDVRNRSNYWETNPQSALYPPSVHTHTHTLQNNIRSPLGWHADNKDKQLQIELIEIKPTRFTGWIYTKISSPEKSKTALQVWGGLFTEVRKSFLWCTVLPGAARIQGQGPE